MTLGIMRATWARNGQGLVPGLGVGRTANRSMVRRMMDVGVGAGG